MRRPPALAVLALLAAGLTAAPASGHQRPASRHWVNTWTSMPQLTEPANLPPAPFLGDGRVFDAATLRQTVHFSVVAESLKRGG
ncbi:hypothetical protein QMK34_41925, partial [Amycolatopsis sp. H20-H5]|nr:hypothetical protein [Amycolatopsis sp. H20-H5]